MNLRGQKVVGMLPGTVFRIGLAVPQARVGDNHPALHHHQTGGGQ